MAERGIILAVNISAQRGEKKRNVGRALIKSDYGIELDAHSGHWHRQVSILSQSSVDKMRAMGAEVDFGDFAENITLEGIEVSKLPIGTLLKAGDVRLEITQIGKECHNQGCAIKKQVGTCVMPLEGIFARVLEGGWIAVGDSIEVME